MLLANIVLAAMNKPHCRLFEKGNENLNMKMIAVLLFSLLISALSMAADTNPNSLRVALLPDEDAATLIKKHQRFKAHLAQALGRDVELLVTTDYSSMIEAMRHGRIDLGYFGPLSYVMARSRSDIEAFAAKLNHGSPTYQAVLIGNIAKGVNSFNDIKGGDVAYGDVASTSSHMIPKKMLLDQKLKAGRDYRAHFLGAHDAVAMAVQRGHAVAGGLSKPIFETLIARGVIDLNKVRILAESKHYPQYPWAMRSNLDAKLKSEIKAAFYQLTDPDILKAFKAEGLAPINDSDYDVVRELKAALKL